MVFISSSLNATTMKKHIALATVSTLVGLMALHTQPVFAATS